MEKYVASLDLYEMYEEANKMIYAALTKVSPTTEYQSFIHQNKRLILKLTVCYVLCMYVSMYVMLCYVSMYVHMCMHACM